MKLTSIICSAALLGLLGAVPAGLLAVGTATVDLRPTHVDLTSATALGAVKVTQTGYLAGNNPRFRLYNGSNQYAPWDVATSAFITSTSYGSGPLPVGDPVAGATYWIIYQRNNNNSDVGSFRDRVDPYSANNNTVVLPAATSIVGGFLLEGTATESLAFDLSTRYVVLAYAGATLVSASSTPHDTVNPSGAYSILIPPATTITTIEFRTVEDELITTITGSYTAATAGLDVTLEIPPVTDDFTVDGGTHNFGSNLDAGAGPFTHTVTINTINASTVDIPVVLPAGISVSPAQLVLGAAATGDFTVTWTPATNDGSSMSETLEFTSNVTPATFNVALAGSTLTETDIAALRTLYETNAAATTGKAYRVSGTVSANNLGALAAHNALTIQTAVDGSIGTRGMHIHDNGGVGLGANSVPAVGDDVEVTGTISNFNGLVQIAPTMEYVVTPGAKAVPVPVVLTGTDVNSDTYESVLARVLGVSPAADSTATTGSDVSVTDGTVFILRTDAVTTGVSIPLYTSGVYTVEGIVGQNNGAPLASGGVGYSVRVRGNSDVNQTSTVADWTMLDN